MSLGQYLAGAVYFIATNGAALLAAAMIGRRRYRFEPALPRALAYLVLGVAAIVFAQVLPAALGVLGRPTALLAALLLLAAATRVPSRVPEAHAGEEPRRAAIPPSSAVSVAIAVVTVIVAVVYELAQLRVLATQPITATDMLNFHLPGVARFMQLGSIWQLDQFLPGFATSQYPNNGDFMLLAAIAPWHDLAFVRFVPLPFYAFTAIGTYALALELGSTRAAAATFAAAIVPVQAISQLALDGMPDVIALSTLLAGVVFLIRHNRSREPAELLLAGLALGLALGTKWYGLTASVPIVVAWLVGTRLAGVRAAVLARRLGSLVAMMLAGGGIWLLRNIVISGNPIYPTAIKPLGLQLFAGSSGDVINRYGYTVADYLLHPQILRTYLYPGFKQQLGFIGLVVIAGVAIALVLGLRALRRDGRTAGRQEMLVLIGSCAALAMAVIYTVTPGSAYGLRNMPVEGFVNIRWLMPAVLCGAAISAGVAGAIGPFGVVLELAGLLGALDGVSQGTGVPGSTVIELLVLIAVVVALWFLLRGRRGRRDRPAGLRPRRTAAIAAFAALAVVLVGGRLDQRSFDRHTYAPYDPTFAWIDKHAPDHHRIGIAGVWSTTGLPPVLPAFGPHLGNTVAYLGVRVRASLHVITEQRRFDAVIRANRFDLLLIGLQQPGRDRSWAVMAGYRLVAISSRLALYQARPGAFARAALGTARGTGRRSGRPTARSLARDTA